MWRKSPTRRVSDALLDTQMGASALVSLVQAGYEWPAEAAGEGAAVLQLCAVLELRARRLQRLLTPHLLDAA